VRWNDEVDMWSERTQLFNAVLGEAADLCVVSRLAPGTTDSNYFLHSSSTHYTSLKHNNAIGNFDEHAGKIHSEFAQNKFHNGRNNH